MGSSAGEVIGVSDGEGDCAEWVFPAAPDAVRTARSLVRRTLGEWRLDSVGDIAALLVSELVTNALRHATGPIGVRLVRGPAGAAGVLLVEVSDPLPDPPRERVARPDDEDGRGLQLVASAARRWGTRPGEAGKTVWFELALPC
ncbi:ATP-binding protein [Streptomyces tendae]|uniref:ATP-binding protein n=1 Tax=Streptomyces tendae TaxID=1932 RepID=UPI00365FCAB0